MHNSFSAFVDINIQLERSRPTQPPQPQPQPQTQCPVSVVERVQQQTVEVPVPQILKETVEVTEHAVPAPAVILKSPAPVIEDVTPAPADSCTTPALQRLKPFWLKPCCLKGLSLVSFSVALAALTILFFIDVLFLGGGIRYRAPWFDGANEVPCLSVYTGVQQQCVIGGHCSAATPKSGTVRSAGLPAECEWIGEGPSAPHTSHEFNRLNGSSRRRRCLEDQENQIRTCERHFCQSYHTRCMVCSRCSLIRGIPAGRHWYLSCHAKRRRRGDARVALGRWTCYSHDKADRSWVGRDRIRSQNISGPVNNVEALLGAAGRCSDHMQVFCAKRRTVKADTSLAVIGFHKKYCHPNAWKTATTRPKSATAYWLKKFGAELVARVEKDNFEKVLRGSGEFGVFSRPFFVKGDARVYKDVPLPVEFDLQAAMRKAKAVGPSILAVVLRGNGLGLRTKECDFESVVGQVYSEEESKRFIGERWEATNLPLSWSKAAVQAFLAGWPCSVEASFRAGKTRSAIIRSAVPPPHRRPQHDFGCSLIWPAEPRKRQNAPDTCWYHKTSLPPLRPSGSRTQHFVRPALASLCPPSAPKNPLTRGCACSAGLAAAYHDYTARTAQNMRCIKPSSFQVEVEKGEGNYET